MAAYRLSPEPVDLQFENEADQVPKSADDELAEHETEEEGEGDPITPQAAASKDHRLCAPGDEEGKPHVVHRPTAADGKPHGMERPLQKGHSHRGEEDAEGKTAAKEPGLQGIAGSRRPRPLRETTIRLPAEVSGRPHHLRRARAQVVID